MKGWAQSVDRVLALRRMVQLEREKAELIQIIQEAEERLAFVVNRQAHEVLKDVPSWKTQGQSRQERARRRRLGGMTTFQEVRRRAEFKLSAEARKRRQREEEFARALGKGFGRDAAMVPRESVARVVNKSSGEEDVAAT